MIGSALSLTERAMDTQLVDVVVTAQSGAFKKGSALVDARLFACPGDFSSPCETDTDVEEISLSRSRP